MDSRICPGGKGKAFIGFGSLRSSRRSVRRASRRGVGAQSANSARGGDREERAGNRYGQFRLTKRTPKNHDSQAKRRAKWNVLKIETSSIVGRPALTSFSSALPVTEEPVGPVIVRHSRLVRICHWVNAICFVVLLMSGMQIFNASPLLTWGQTTNFERPFFSLSATHDGDGNATAGVTTIFGHAFNTTGVLGASLGDDGSLEERGFPAWATLPSYQDLALGRRWHFFFAWILVLNGLLYFMNLIFSRHIRDLWPSLA